MATPARPTRRDLRSLAGLRRVIARLRGPDGCPWDRAQTHETLRPFLLEEASETLAALDEGDAAHLREELGDLLFHVFLHAQIAEERGDFTLEDVVFGVADKLVRRHPHVFEGAVADTVEAVVEQWDEIKREERGGRSALTGIPPALPSLAYAQTIQGRAEKAGFAFTAEEQVWEALQEELDELRSAATPEERRDEAGDAFFALANLARYLGTDAEEALRLACRRFAQRFQRMESIVAEQGVDLRQAALEDKLSLWQQAKAEPQRVREKQL